MSIFSVAAFQYIVLLITPFRSIRSDESLGIPLSWPPAIFLQSKTLKRYSGSWPLSKNI